MEPFFFQAEDGIRDYKVTGVQTCALPIYRQVGTFPEGSDLPARATGKSGPSRKVRTCRHGRPVSRDLRSEERRGGREGRAGWAPCQHNKSSGGRTFLRSGVADGGKDSRSG